jgi:hypothetical protein
MLSLLHLFADSRSIHEKSLHPRSPPPPPRHHASTTDHANQGVFAGLPLFGGVRMRKEGGGRALDYIWCKQRCRIAFIPVHMRCAHLETGRRDALYDDAWRYLWPGLEALETDRRMVSSDGPPTTGPSPLQLEYMKKYVWL